MTRNAFRFAEGIFFADLFGSIRVFSGPASANGLLLMHAELVWPLRIAGDNVAIGKQLVCQNAGMSFFGKLFGKSNKPNPDDLVRDALRKQGDNGTKVRPVEHLAYFKTMDATQAFMDWVIANGYTLDNSNHEFGVKFVKDCAVAGPEFDRELSMLRSKVKSMKGEYDGWGCPVAK